MPSDHLKMLSHPFGDCRIVTSVFQCWDFPTEHGLQLGPENKKQCHKAAMTGNGNLIPPIFRYDSIPFIHKLLKRMASAEKKQTTISREKRLRSPRQPETPVAWPKLSTKSWKINFAGG